MLTVKENHVPRVKTSVLGPDDPQGDLLVAHPHVNVARVHRVHREPRAGQRCVVQAVKPRRIHLHLEHPRTVGW